MFFSSTLMSALANRGMRYRCFVLKASTATSGRGSLITYQARTKDPVPCDFNLHLLPTSLETLDTRPTSRPLIVFFLPVWTGMPPRDVQVLIDEKDRLRVLASDHLPERLYEVVGVQQTDSSTQRVMTVLVEDEATET